MMAIHRAAGEVVLLSKYVVVSNMFIFTPNQKGFHSLQFDVRRFFRWVGEKPPTSQCILICNVKVLGSCFV